MIDKRPMRLVAAMFAGTASLLAVAGCAAGPAGSPGPGASTRQGAAATSAPAASAAAAGSQPGLTGCKLISQQEAAQELGPPASAGFEAPKQVKPPIMSAKGCEYHGSGGSIGYDVLTYAFAVPTTLLTAQAAAHHVHLTSVADATAYVATSGSETVAVAAKGSVTYTVIVSRGRPGAALAILTLLIQRS